MHKWKPLSAHKSMHSNTSDNTLRNKRQKKRYTRQKILIGPTAHCFFVFYENDPPDSCPHCTPHTQRDSRGKVAILSVDDLWFGLFHLQCGLSGVPSTNRPGLGALFKKGDHCWGQQAHFWHWLDIFCLRIVNSKTWLNKYQFLGDPSWLGFSLSRHLIGFYIKSQLWKWERPICLQVRIGKLM